MKILTNVFEFVFPITLFVTMFAFVLGPAFSGYYMPISSISQLLVDLVPDMRGDVTSINIIIVDLFENVPWLAWILSPVLLPGVYTVFMPLDFIGRFIINFFTIVTNNFWDYLVRIPSSSYGLPEYPFTESYFPDINPITIV